jgi:hypothetical protein
MAGRANPGAAERGSESVNSVNLTPILLSDFKNFKIKVDKYI